MLSVLGAADYSDAASVGIPRGSIFSVEGSGLAASAASAAALPLPTTLNGVTVRVWDAPAGGNFLGVCPLWYVSPTQVNAILPSSLAAGQYYLSSVTAGFETGRLPIIATNGRFAAFSQGGQGFGPAVVQQYDTSGGPFLNKLTTAAAPGSVLVLWGSGLGALPSGSDADAPQPGTIRSDITVYVDGLPATPLYAGRAPTLPGVDQINFALPAGVKARCFVPLQVVTGGASSGLETISVSAGSSTCPSELGLSSSALATLDAGGVARAAILRMTSTTNHSDGAVEQSAEAWTAEYNASYLSVLALGANAAPVNGAAVCSRNPLDRAYGQNTSAGIAVPVITGSSGCTWAFVTTGTLVEGSPPSACIASSYIFSGPLFTASGTFPSPRAANMIATLSSQRSTQGLSISWAANPSPSDDVTLTIGSSFTPVTLFGTSETKSVQFACQMNAAASPFTFSPNDLTWALQYANANPVSIYLTTTTDQAFPANSQFDFVLVRVVNSVEATAPVTTMSGSIKSRLRSPAVRRTAGPRPVADPVSDCSPGDAWRNHE